MLETGEVQHLNGVAYTLPDGSTRRVLLHIAPVTEGGQIVGGIASAWPDARRPA